MNPVSSFAQTYAEARDKFLAAARARGATIFRHVHPTERGSEGEELSIDLALLGNDDAPGLLLLTSATHGVEGFCGSGCQVALLHDDAFAAALERSGAALLMLHAVNPYGFSHLRRVNEDNADMNRNFQNFDAPLPVNEAYAGLHALLLPESWPPGAANEARLWAWIAMHGRKAYQAAVSGGQYQYPTGMFYGGIRPSWSNRTVRAVLREHAARRARLGWIDYHTALGPRGHGEKIYAGRNDAVEVARARDWWASEVTSFYDGSSSSATLTGVMCSAMYQECPRTECTAIALEYGTYPLLQVLQALRAEHWVHNHPAAPAAQRVDIKRRMRDVFYIDADDWKQQVYPQALDACVKALARLAEARIHA